MLEEIWIISFASAIGCDDIHTILLEKTDIPDISIKGRCKAYLLKLFHIVQSEYISKIIIFAICANIAYERYLNG